MGVQGSALQVRVGCDSIILSRLGQRLGSVDLGQALENVNVWGRVVKYA